MPMSQVFAQIRSECKKKVHPREENGPGHQKVLARNDECFITELPDKWRVDYERRVGHRHTGYFAHSHVPYATFGNLRHTDVYDLIGDSLGIAMEKHWHYMQMLNLTQVAQHDQTSQETDDSLNTIVVVCDGSNKRRQHLPYSRNAGLSSMRVALGSNTRAMQDMAAGSSFKETTKLEKERLNYLTRMRARKEVKQDGRHVSVTRPSYYLRPLLHTASSKTCLIGSNLKRPPKTEIEPPKMESLSDQELPSDSKSDKHQSRGGGSMYLAALAATQFKLHGTDKNAKVLKCKQDQELLLKLKEKEQRECVARLKCVYAILCCLHNIKVKELKTKEPLPFSTVKALSQKPLNSLAKDYYYDTHPYNGLPTLHNHLSTAPHHVLHSRHTLPNHSNGLLQGKQKNQGRRQFPLVENWGDLVDTWNDTEDKGKTPLHSTAIADGSSVILPKTGSKETVQQGHGEVYVGGAMEHHHKSHRALPPWQRQVIYVTNKDESLKRDPSKKLSDCIESFHYFKSKMSHKMKSLLIERKQHLEKYMALKLANLELGANTAKCLEEMREKAYRMRRQERTVEDNKPQWYDLLEKEVSTVFELEDASEARAMLEKLKQLLTMDTDTLPYMLEKLCLLFMSLPAHYLSLRPVFTAVQFVTEHIVKSPPIICQQWMDIRQLPLTTTELPDLAYLFGMRV